MSGFLGKILNYGPTGSQPATAWVRTAIEVPCPSCGVPVRVPDVATAEGRGPLGALHKEPTCERFDRIAAAGIGGLAAYLREIAESEPDEGPPS